MSDEPKMMRWGEVLVLTKLTDYALRQLKTAGVITPIYLRPKSRAYYSREEITREVLNAGTPIPPASRESN